MNSLYYINIEKRTNENSTHHSLNDDSISYMIPYKINKTKFIISILLHILTLGITYYIFSKFAKLSVKLYFSICKIREADHIVIIDDEDKYYISPILKNKFLNEKFTIIQLASKDEMKKSFYVDDELYSNESEDIIYIYFRYTKYIYLENKNCFMALRSNITRFTNVEIHENLKNGISKISEYNYLVNKYDFNLINIGAKSFIGLLINQLFMPWNLYQLISIVIWIKNFYYFFAIIIIIFLIISIIVNTFKDHKNFELSIKTKNKQIKVKRNLDVPDTKNYLGKEICEYSESSEYLVPGDIIELDEDEIIPCDCLLLEGRCTINESELTGETNFILKLPLPYDNCLFKFHENASSLLYSGTKIDKIERDMENKIDRKSDNRKILLLVLNTGFNTNRGNLIQSLLFPKESNFKFYKDIIFFFIVMALIFIANFVILLLVYYNYCNNGDSIKNCFTSNDRELSITDKILDSLTVIFPPMLPMTMFFSALYHHYNLNLKKISCINNSKLNAAGRVNIMIFDKTGTLTEEGVILHGFQTTKVLNSSIELDEMEKSGMIYNKLHLELWKKISLNNIKNYQIDPEYNIIYFTECLATCHSVDRLRECSFGDIVDCKILENIEWKQEKCDDRKQNMNHVKYKMIPKNPYLINEFLIKSDNNNPFLNKIYELRIVKRFLFYSKFKSMSVIVQNLYDNSYRYYIKGAPEKIHLLCKEESIPDNYDENLLEHTKNGYRVLACATKLLEGDDYENEIDRHIFENNLTFLGFIIFKNKLKVNAPLVINKLKNNNCKVVISTGDNPYTSINVGKEANFIEEEKNLYVIEYDDNNFKFLCLNKEDDKRKSKNNELIEKLDKSLISRKSIKEEIRLTRRSKFELSNYESFFNTYSSNKDNTICISGAAFMEMIHRYSDNKLNSFRDQNIIKLHKLVYDDGKIFFRMSPNDKVQLVKFYKESDTNIVGMCGDGANDCGAILCADSGIVISNGVNIINVMVHFYCYTSDLFSVYTIIKYGRACFETTMVIFKYMIICAILQLSSAILVIFYQMELTDDQYMFLDGTVLAACLIIAKTDSNVKKEGSEPIPGSMSIKFVFSFISHTLICLLAQYLYYFYIFKSIVSNIKIDSINSYKDSNIINSYISLLNSFQNFIILFIINNKSKNRKNNRLYNLYACIILYHLTSTLTSTFFEVSKNLNTDEQSYTTFHLFHTGLSAKSMQTLRIGVLGICVSNFLVSWLIEKLIYMYL